MTATRYALKREVAAERPVFPWSMSDFKPGEVILMHRTIVSAQGNAVCPDVFYDHPEYACPLPRKRDSAIRFLNVRARNTRAGVRFLSAPPAKLLKEAIQVAVKEKIRIRIKGYDHQLVDQSAEKIVATAKRAGAQVS